MLQQTREIPYAWEKLMSTKRQIRQVTKDMTELRQKIEILLPISKDRAKQWYGELCGQHQKLLEHLAACRLCLLEMGLEQESNFAAKLHQAVKQFSLMTPDYTRFAGGLEGFLSQLPEGDETVTTNATIIGRLMNRVRLGYYPTDPTHIDHIIRGIGFPENVVTNLLDPCCGCGLALRQLATGNNCMAYGVELDEDRAVQAQEQLHRVGVGSYFHSRISHNAFHMLFLNPPYLSVLREGGGNVRSEKLFLVDTMKHLTLGGLLVYVIPHYRLTEDIARVLCDNFTDLSVYKFMGKEFERFHQIVVFGVLQKRADCSALVDNFVEMVDDIDHMPPLSDISDNRYPLPDREITVETFKGAVFNELELYRQLKKSDSLTRLITRSALDSREKRPLLPLNIGQIGLIAGSGMINGLVEGDYPHLIKGRIIKQIKRETASDELTMTETITNKMVFNLLTPDGFRALT